MPDGLTSEPTRPRFPGRVPLCAWQDDVAWFVAWEGFDDDWLVRFDKSAGVEAEQWALNMVRVYNARLEREGEARAR